MSSRYVEVKISDIAVANADDVIGTVIGSVADELHRCACPGFMDWHKQCLKPLTQEDMLCDSCREHCSEARRLVAAGVKVAMNGKPLVGQVP